MAAASTFLSAANGLRDAIQCSSHAIYFSWRHGLEGFAALSGLHDAAAQPFFKQAVEAGIS